MNTVEKAINILLRTKPFFAHFFLNSTTIYTNKNIPTAGATMGKNGAIFYFNPEFVATLTPEELAAIVEHEVLHVVFRHCFIIKDSKTFKHAKCQNIAMDIAINQYIDNLPKHACTPEWLEKMVKKPVLREQTWEYYYQLILEDIQKNGGKDPEMDTLDVHIEMADGEGANGEPLTPEEMDALKDQLGAMIQDRVDQAIKQANGTVPSNVLKALDALRAKPQIKWETQLKNFMGKNISTSTKFSRKKPNRRFDLDQPGKTKKRELTLGVCVDSSGSISDESYDKFMAEVMAASKACMKVYVIEADCVVQRVEVLTKHKKPALVRHGMGGTAYQPAISKSLELGCDAIIYFGDMDSADSPQDPQIPFLWVAVGDQKPPANFGTVLRLK